MELNYFNITKFNFVSITTVEYVLFMSEKSIFIEVKDYSVSKEKFQLLYNEELEFLETFPKPEAEELPNYYKSENYISHTDSKRNLFEKSYHFIRQIALKNKLKLITSFKTKDKNLLDIGCGTGDFLQVAKQQNWNVTGVEPNVNAREIANRKVTNTVYDIDALRTLKNESFDVITLWHVLEHLPNLKEDVSTLKRLLKPKGVLIIAVPNYKSFDATYYNNFWAAYDVPRHLWHFSQTSISKLFASENMKIEKTVPMHFDAFYVSLLSEKYKTGRMNYFKAFRIGLQSNLKAKSSGEYSSLIYCLKNG